MERFWVSVLAVVVAVSVSACGDDETVEPVVVGGQTYAVASVMQVNDTVGEKVVAQLIVVAGGDEGPRFVDNAADVVLRFNGQEVVLPAQRVELRGEGADGLQTNFYRVDSQANPDLIYTPGVDYTFVFTGPGPDGDTTFDAPTYVMTITAPSTEGSVAVASTPERDKQLDVFTPDAFGSGILQVVMASSGEPTYVSYPYSEATLGSAAAVLDSVGSLGDHGGGLLTVPAEAFTRQGTYDVTYIGLNAKSGTAAGEGLGEFSSIFAGAAAETSVDVP